eukprot:1196326-Prorocentrum_minimum.AAC.1
MAKRSSSGVDSATKLMQSVTLDRSHSGKSGRTPLPEKSQKGSRKEWEKQGRRKLAQGDGVKGQPNKGLRAKGNSKQPEQKSNQEGRGSNNKKGASAQRSGSGPAGGPAVEEAKWVSEGTFWGPGMVNVRVKALKSDMDARYRDWVAGKCPPSAWPALIYW